MGQLALNQPNVKTIKVDQPGNKTWVVNNEYYTVAVHWKKTMLQTSYSCK